MLLTLKIIFFFFRVKEQNDEWEKKNNKKFYKRTQSYTHISNIKLLSFIHIYFKNSKYTKIFAHIDDVDDV